MASDPVGDVIAAQSSLIAALDARSPDDIVAATTRLAETIALLKAQNANQQDVSKIDHAMRQSEAALIRVNILSDWNRQRIDRLAELRGQKPQFAYRRP
jgi:hypothetical protein